MRRLAQAWAWGVSYFASHPSTFLLAIGAASSQVAGVGITFAIVWALGPESLGAYALVMSTLALAGVFAGTGLSVACTRQVAKAAESDPARLGAIVSSAMSLGGLSATLIMAGMILLSETFAAMSLQSSEFRWTLAAAAPLLLFQSCNSLQIATLFGLQRFRSVALGNLAAAGLKMSAATLLLIGGGLNVLFGILGVAALFSTWYWHRLVSEALVRDGAALTWRSSSGDRRSLLAFAYPTIASSAVVGPTNWFALQMLATRGGGLAQVGVVGLAAQWEALIRFWPQRQLEAFFPRAIRVASTRDAKAYTTAFGMARSSICLSSIVCASILAVGAPWILRAYQSSMDAEVNAFRVFAFVATLQVVARLYTQDLLARGLPGTELVTVAARCLVYIALLIPLLFAGALGIALAQAVSYLGLVGWLEVNRRRKLGA